VDALIAELAQAYAARAEEFARATVEENHMGNLAD